MHKVHWLLRDVVQVFVTPNKILVCLYSSKIGSGYAKIHSGSRGCSECFGYRNVQNYKKKFFFFK